MQLDSVRQEMKTQLRQKDEEIALLKRSAAKFSSEDGEKDPTSELKFVFQHELRTMREAFILKLKHKDELLKLQESEHRRRME